MVQGNDDHLEWITFSLISLETISNLKRYKIFIWRHDKQIQYMSHHFPFTENNQKTNWVFSQQPKNTHDPENWILHLSIFKFNDRQLKATNARSFWFAVWSFFQFDFLLDQPRIEIFYKFSQVSTNFSKFSQIFQNVPKLQRISLNILKSLRCQGN